MATAEGGLADGCSRVWVIRLEWNPERIVVLLKWFRRQIGGASSDGSVAQQAPSEPSGPSERLALVFPPSLSKEDRAIVHKKAQAMHLVTHSQGLGDGRHIRVLSQPLDEGEASGAAASSTAAGATQAMLRAQIVYRLAQEPAEDGVHLGQELSLGELQEALRTGGELPGRYAALGARAGKIVAAACGAVPTVPMPDAAANYTGVESRRVRMAFQRSLCLRAV